MELARQEAQATRQRQAIEAQVVRAEQARQLLVAQQQRAATAARQLLEEQEAAAAEAARIARLHADEAGVAAHVEQADARTAAAQQAGDARTAAQQARVIALLGPEPPLVPPVQALPVMQGPPTPPRISRARKGCRCSMARRCRTRCLRQTWMIWITAPRKTRQKSHLSPRTPV